MNATSISRRLGCTRTELWARMEEYPDAMFANCRSQPRVLFVKGTEIPVPHVVRLPTSGYLNFGRDDRGRVVHFFLRSWSSGCYAGLSQQNEQKDQADVMSRRYFRLPRAMTVLEIAALLKCHRPIRW